MKIDLPYGRKGLSIELPDPVDIVSGSGDRERALPGPQESLLRALEHPAGSPPLRSLIKPGSRVVVVHTDITRATPNHIIIPPLVTALNDAGVPPENIVLLNATGMHRGQTTEELHSMLGADIAGRCVTVQHDARDRVSLRPAGTMPSGNTLFLNRAWLEADFRITTGFIEPHFFAGFSGGPKAVLPGIAAEENILYNHRPENIDHPMADWGVTAGNPVWEEMAAAARLAPPDFLVNVALNAEKQITGVFAGEMFGAHARGCAFVKERAMIAVDAPYDIVITTNSGYPLDLNLYQAVKGMSAASRITARGGVIIMAAACEEGIPARSCYADILSRFSNPASFLSAVRESGASEAEQWQVLVQAKVLSTHDVYLYSGGLSAAETERSMLKPCADIPQTLRLLLRKFGKGARVAVLPGGPQCIPYVKHDAGRNKG